MRSFKPALLTVIFTLTALATAAAMPPESPKKPVTDVYHGSRVVDDYRWLEDWNDPAVQKWSDAQNESARASLDHLPHVAEIRARVTEIMSAKTVSYAGVEYRKGTYFAIKREPPKQQPFLIAFASLDAVSEARVLVDPNTIDPAGTTSIDWYVPSPDGKIVAVSLSHAGTEAGDVHVYETSGGKEVHEVIPRVNTGTAGGDLAWRPDGTGFFDTRHPRPGERPADALDFFQQVYFHKLGTATADDRYEIGRDYPRVAEIELTMDNASGRLLATVQYGDGGEFAIFLRSPEGDWRRIADFPDRIIQAAFGLEGALFLLSRAGAPRGKIIRVPAADPVVARAMTVIPEGPEVIVSSFGHGPPTLLATKERLYVLYQLGGPSELRVFDLAGKRLDAPRQLPLSSVGGLTRLDSDDVIFSSSSYLAPAAYYRFRSQTNRTEKTALETKSPVEFSDVEVIREFAASRDGTKVPVNIIMLKGTKIGRE